MKVLAMRPSGSDKTCEGTLHATSSNPAGRTTLLRLMLSERENTMEALVRLPGVGRKTANVVLGNAFGKDEGFVVDTHVGRLARRLGFTRERDPVKVERDASALVPRGRRTLAAHLLIFHGRRLCTARKPRCPECPVADLCPKVGVEVSIKIRAQPFRISFP